LVRDQFALVHQPRFDAATKAITDVAALNQQRATEMLELVDRESRALLVGIALSFTLAVGLALVVGLGLFRSITTPLARLGGLMDAVRQGDFTQRMEVDRTDEFGDLARGFNRMTDEVMELVGQVQRSGIRVSTSMTEIAATSKQQQATATEVAATTTQIGATSREIAATSRELVRTMTDVASVADNAASLASSGQSGLAHMEETMGHVMEAASSINAKLAVLNEKAGDINQVVTTITKVADQTNLLSLNAAIEAEKAGEYGRGFAVVSSEIRRLADQTAVATYDIEQMVKEIQSAVSAGVMGMDKFSEEVRRGLHDVHEIGGKLSEIIAQVQALAPRFENVSEGMQAQATGAEQISEALVQLTEATQQTVEALRQSSSAIDELNQVSGNLHGSIARFKLAAA
jgi:methyl-accepting chemotaxis protein WspA